MFYFNNCFILFFVGIKCRLVRHMSLTKGWWMLWSSPALRRSGAFTVEIVERAPQNTVKDQFEKGIVQFKDKMMKRPSISLGAIGAVGGMEALGAMGALNNNSSSNAVGTAGNAAPNSSNANTASNFNNNSNNAMTTSRSNDSKPADASGVLAHDNILRCGDFFRLRSLKFPEFELGITHEKIRDDFCYLGLRKVISWKYSLVCSLVCLLCNWLYFSICCASPIGSNLFMCFVHQLG